MLVVAIAVTASVPALVPVHHLVTSSQIPSETETPHKNLITTTELPVFGPKRIQFWVDIYSILLFLQ